MKNAPIDNIPLSDFCLWEKMQEKRVPSSFVLELTARCNLNCRHCYLNRPSADPVAKAGELSAEKIGAIADEAVSLGSLWCLLSGGEPLLRKDFESIYVNLKRKGLLVSVFTNATIIQTKHVQLFQKYPPRSLEVTVYGNSRGTYERVTRTPGSYRMFRKGLDLLLEAGIQVTLKAMALRSNLHELFKIADFCRKHSSQPFRFDTFLNLRTDRDPERNKDIIKERLSPEEVAQLDQMDLERKQALQKHCQLWVRPEEPQANMHTLLYCAAGLNSFSVSNDGFFRLCPWLCHRQCQYDLNKGTVTEAWKRFTPKVRNLTSNREEYLKRCQACSLINICSWCPAHADLETGKLDLPVDYFCKTAHLRVNALMNNKK